MDWLGNLKTMKRQSGMTTAQISKASKIPEPTLEKLFAGATKDPKLKTMTELVHCLGFTLDDLIELNPETKKAPAPEKSETDVGLNTIITCYQRMSADGRQRLVEQAEFLLTKYPKQKIESGTA